MKLPGFLKKLFGKGEEDSSASIAQPAASQAPVSQDPNPGVPGAVDQVSAAQTANAPTPVSPTSAPQTTVEKPA